MKNEDVILDALEDLKIESGLTRENLTEVLSEWTLYSQLLSKISKELKVVANLDEVITPLDKGDDISSCLMEISCLLTELSCPYTIITEGNLNSRFETNEKRLLVLNFLLSELQASQMIFMLTPAKTRSTNMKIKLEESEQARLLREILQCLEFSKPTDDIDISTLCGKIQERTLVIQTKLKSSHVKVESLLKGTLTESHWRQIEKFNKELYAEYKLRRDMLLKRLDVTIQSFQWSNTKTDKLKDRNQAISDRFKDIRSKLDNKPDVSLAELLAARTDLMYFEKTSSGSLRENTKSEVNKVRIGKVPDRGGRPNEVQPPPPEMPPWQQRQAGGSGSVGWTQRGGGGRAGGRGQSHQSRGGGNWGHQSGGNRGGYREAQGGGGESRDSQSGGGGYRDSQNSGGGYRDYQSGGGGYRDSQSGGGGYRDSQSGGGGYRDSQSGGGGYRDSQSGGGGYRDSQGRGGGYRDSQLGGDRGSGGQQFCNSNENLSDRGSHHQRGRGNYARDSLEDHLERQPPRVQSGWYGPRK